MIKSTWKLDNKIKSCAASLSANEISGNDREKALELKKKFDESHVGKTKRMVPGKNGIWKEVWE